MNLNTRSSLPAEKQSHLKTQKINAEVPRERLLSLSLSGTLKRKTSGKLTAKLGTRLATLVKPRAR
jgi:hypothetical protein